MIITERTTTEEKPSRMKSFVEKVSAKYSTHKAAELVTNVATTAESMLQTGMPILMEAGVAITLLSRAVSKAKK